MPVEFAAVLEEGTETEGQAAQAAASGAAARAAIPPSLRPLSARARKKIMRRRRAEIRSYIGPNGSGKTAMAVMDLLPVLEGQRWRCDNPDHRHTRRGITSGVRRVLSTAPILDPQTGEPHALYTKLGGSEPVPGDLEGRTGGWWQVLEAEHCDLLFDEVTGIAGSRESMGMPVVVQNILQQLRRADVFLSWTAPSWARADSTIRSCTLLVTDCRGHMQDRKLLRGETPPAWLPKRLFKARSFNAQNFDEWTAAKAAQSTNGPVKPLRPDVVQWWWGPRSLTFASYNTYGAVSRVGEVLDGGRCAHCGGRRAVPVCKCEH